MSSPLENPNLNVLLGNRPIDKIDMFLKVFSRDITALKLKNENLFLRTSVHEDGVVPRHQVPYIHANRPTQCCNQLPGFTLSNPRAHPFYQCEDKYLSYGISKNHIEESGWNVAALSVMSGTDCFVVVHELATSTDAKCILLPVFVGESNVFTGVKCITYAYDAAKRYHTVVVEMPTSTYEVEHVVEAEEWMENGDIYPCETKMEMGGSRIYQPRRHTYMDYATAMPMDGSTTNIILRSEDDQTAIVHIQFIPKDSVCAFLASKPPAQRPREMASLGDNAALTHIREMQRLRYSSEAESFFPKDTIDNALLAQYQQQVRETGIPPHPNTISPDMRAMLDRLQTRQNQIAKSTQSRDNDTLNQAAMQKRIRDCSRDQQLYREEINRRVAAGREQRRAELAQQEAIRREKMLMEKRAREEEQARRNREIQEAQISRDLQISHLRQVHEYSTRQTDMLKEQVEMQDFLRNIAEAHEAHEKSIQDKTDLRSQEIAARESQCLASDMCSVCMERPKTMVAIPCGHYAMCSECSNRYPTKCAICRQSVREWVRIYSA